MVCFLKLWKIKSIIFKNCFSNLILLTQEHRTGSGGGAGAGDIWQYTWCVSRVWWPHGDQGMGTRGCGHQHLVSRVQALNPWLRIPQTDMWIFGIIQTATFSRRMTPFSTYYGSPHPVNVTWTLVSQEDRSLDSPMSQHAPAWSLLIPDQLRSSSSSAPSFVILSRHHPPEPENGKFNFHQLAINSIRWI